MTRCDYMDREGNFGSIEDVYQVKHKAYEQLVAKSEEHIQDENGWWTTATSAKEKALADHVKRNGGTVLSIVSQPISKRRYKRKVAKLIKRNNKILASFGTE